MDRAHSTHLVVRARHSLRSNCCSEDTRLREDWRKIASLTMSARVKHFLSTLLHALEEERHFALIEGVAFAFPTVGSLVIVFRSGTRSDPCISSVCHCDHDYYFELLAEEEQDAQSISRCSIAHHGDVRAVLRANRTCSTADSPTPNASSSTDELPACGPSRP